MKISNRKMISWIVGIVWLSLIMVIVVFAKPPVEWVPIFLSCITAGLLLSIAFIGGTVWKDYIKSKYFQSDLFESGKE